MLWSLTMWSLLLLLLLTLLLLLLLRLILQGTIDALIRGFVNGSAQVTSVCVCPYSMVYLLSFGLGP